MDIDLMQYHYLFVFIFLEVLEIRNLRGNTFKDMLLHVHALYVKNPLLYMGLHMSFFYLIYVSFAIPQPNIWIYSAIVLKGMDVALKFLLIGKIMREGESVVDRLTNNAEIPVTPGLRYSSLIILSAVLCMGLS